jgi:hypothetical protein
MGFMRNDDQREITSLGLTSTGKTLTAANSGYKQRTPRKKIKNSAPEPNRRWEYGRRLWGDDGCRGRKVSAGEEVEIM